MLSVARALARRGHTVTFYGSQTMAELVESGGVEFLPLESFAGGAGPAVRGRSSFVRE
ncbi:MAG: hypothetical protein QGI46_03700 [Planctomycetota bacterium]|jgi:UDP:flavonoid glycosyltransferase YjiC (YdhE family)|nr:hypothetical protein [Planctomycetota bacterium]